MKAMLFAAGTGTRFLPYTHKIAKPAIPFLNLPLLAFPLYLLEQLGVNEVMINTHHLPASIHHALQPIQKHLKLKVHFSHEEPIILSSGGGLRKVKDFFKTEENFLLANADTLMLFPHAQGLIPFYNEHTKNSPLASILVCDHPGVGKEFGGIWVNGNQVVDICKKNPEPNLRGLHYTGYMAFHQHIFDYLPEQEVSHIFIDALLPAIKQGEAVLSYEEKADWFETGDPQSYLKASQDCMHQLSLAKIKGDSDWQTIDTLRTTFDYFKVAPKMNSLGGFLGS